MIINFFVPGSPSGQGSKKPIRRGKKTILVDMNANLQPWRDSITWKAMEARQGQRFDGPVRVDLTFVYSRPQSHYGTGRNAGVLKDSAPSYKESAPDIDKLERAVFDALTASAVWVDDSRAVEVHKVKIYGAQPGVHITLTEPKPIPL